MPAAAAAFATSQQRIIGVDAQSFVQAGRTLLSSHWDRAFSASDIQAGPLQLALYGSLGRWPLALAFLLSTATALLVIVAAGRSGCAIPCCSRGPACSASKPG